MTLLGDQVKQFVQGIVLLLAIKHSQQLSGRGEIVLLLAALFAILFLINTLDTHVFVTSSSSHGGARRSRAFDGLAWLVQSVLMTLSLYVGYMLTRELNDWAWSRFIDGPMRLELVVYTLSVLIMFSALVFHAERHGDADPRDVDELMQQINCIHAPPPLSSEDEDCAGGDKQYAQHAPLSMVAISVDSSSSSSATTFTPMTHTFETGSDDDDEHE